ncbi:MAG: hypothetical protein N2235_05180 [Fischerella sp.]|nr:hypothetical protein [Fischerella sp.]
MALITHAGSADEAKLEFHKQFGSFFSAGCEVEEGVVRNTYTRHLFSEALLHAAEVKEGRANIRLYASSHFNYS